MTGLDKLLQKYPGHALTDDAWYLKGQLQRRTGDYPGGHCHPRAASPATPSTTCSATTRCFCWPRIQEEDVKDKAKAQELYNQVLTKYPGSIYVAEARKRFRKLRGDDNS